MEWRDRVVEALVAMTLLVITVGGGATARAMEAQSLPLDPLLSAPVGSEAAYVIEQHVERRVIRRSGMYSAVPADWFEESYTNGAYVEYTVLAPASDGRPRIEVRATPIDTQTGERQLVLSTWTGTFVLRDEPVLESEVEPYYRYEALFTPYFLTWGAEGEPLPMGGIIPGERWSSLGGEAAESVAGSSPHTGFEGEFIGWEPVPWGSDVGARVRHVSTHENIEERSYHGAWEVIQTSAQRAMDVWLLPQSFPLGADLLLRLVTEESIGDPGEASEGSVTTETEVRLSVRPADQRPVDRAFPIGTEDVVFGRLTEASRRLDDDSPLSVYAITAEMDEVLEASLISSDFDAYLFVLDKEWKVLASDDNSLGETDAALTIRLPYTGTYYIVANSWSEFGDYTLQVRTHPAYAPDTEELDSLLGTVYERLDDVLSAVAQSDVKAARQALANAWVEMGRAETPAFHTAWVAAPPAGIGQYTEVEPRFYPGETLRLYVEPFAFHLRETEGRYYGSLRADVQILNTEGETIWEREGAASLRVEAARRPVYDAYLSIQISGVILPRGEYWLRLHVYDDEAGTSATVWHRFTVDSLALLR